MNGLSVQRKRSDSDKKSGRKADELDLVKRISSGDQSAMKQVYELYSKPLTHFVKNWLANPHEASDIVHETMLEVWRRADRFQDKSIDKNRKLSRLSYTDDVPEMADDDAGPADILEASQDSVLLKSCIAELSETHRRMIHLAFYEDLSYREIAEIEDCPIGTVKTRILHAKKLLMGKLAR